MSFHRVFIRLMIIIYNILHSVYGCGLRIVFWWMIKIKNNLYCTWYLNASYYIITKTSWILNGLFDFGWNSIVLYGTMEGRLGRVFSVSKGQQEARGTIYYAVEEVYSLVFRFFFRLRVGYLTILCTVNCSFMCAALYTYIMCIIYDFANILLLGNVPMYFIVV